MRNVSQQILCNGANLPESFEFIPSISLEYGESTGNPNVKLALPNFIREVSHLPDPILDLLEIASYVFCADRLIPRGKKYDLEFHSWPRRLHFIIKVRDYDFWNTPTIKRRLEEALVFMSGDQEHSFTFQPGHSTPPADLFDNKMFQIEPQRNTKVILFSGGLDSLTGVVECLEHSSDQLCLISHRSGQPRTAKTQDQLIKALQQRYPNRITHYKFACSLRKIRGREETQRTRVFLYTSIAYALSHALSQGEIYVYENGITSINFPTQESLINARASRTTHPKTMILLQNFFNSFSEINQTKFEIATPFLWKTKTDIFHILDRVGQKDLISSTVSCSQTFQHHGQATHCGGCSQCIDRRFAAYSSGLDDVDEGGIYAFDFIRRKIENPEVKTVLTDYVRQAKNFASLDLENFYYKMLPEFEGFIDYIPGTNEKEKIEKIWKLCHRHGQQVGTAIGRMQTIHDNPYLPLPKRSFLQMIAEREYLDDPSQEQDSSMSTSSRPQVSGVKVFCAYSHQDETLRDHLESHLSSLKRRGVIEVWHDRRISAGAEWDREIHEHLNTSHIILLLISSDFLASDYCYNIEMNRAIERHDAGEACVIPIILRSVDWEEESLSRLLALPRDARAVTLWENQDEAFTNIARGIKQAIEDLNQS